MSNHHLRKLVDEKSIHRSSRKPDCTYLWAKIDNRQATRIVVSPQSSETRNIDEDPMSDAEPVDVPSKPEVWRLIQFIVVHLLAIINSNVMPITRSFRSEFAGTLIQCRSNMMILTLLAFPFQSTRGQEGVIVPHFAAFFPSRPCHLADTSNCLNKFRRFGFWWLCCDSIHHIAGSQT
jgi:hypothetical protein